MSEATYVDLLVLAELGDDDYLVRVSKKDLHSLVTFDDSLVLRHWDGEKPVLLEAYGVDAVRTKEDAKEGNNLTELPKFPEGTLAKVLQ